MSKINRYIFIEISKSTLLMLFIFLSISWILQFTRLISLTNLIQVDIVTIFNLSLFLIPNLVTIIMPFVIMFSLILTFIKLHRDRELISIYSLGLNIKSIFNPLFFFSSIILVILIILNFYISPNVYKNYKIKEHEIRNKINFEKIIISNFVEINKNTYIDFKRNKEKFNEVFIKFSENKDNMIYAREADIKQKNDKFYFNLIDGFKITILETNKIEKLEFNNYTLEITNNSFEEYDNFDINTFNFFDDLKNKNYINIFYKINDSIIVLVIILFFYLHNIVRYKLNIISVLFFIFFSSIILIINQILKNSEFNLFFNILFNSNIFILIFTYLLIGKINVKN